MNIKSYFAEKLSKLLFLEVKKENIKKIFHVLLKEDIYIPIDSKHIVDSVKLKDNLDKIPVTYFIEGMFYVLGADEDFKFNKYYRDIISKDENNNNFIKSIIGKNIKNKNYEEGYIILKGLSQVENTVEIYDKLIIMAEELRKENSIFKEEELNILQKAKLKDNYALPYLYEAIIKKEEGDYEGALFCINNYTKAGGEETPDVTDMKQWLKYCVDYDRGKELLESNPLEALKYLIPLVDVLGDNASVYYYIAVGYRMIANHEKAIYYLNEALNIDSSILEIVNEMGINYASLGNYERAIAYLRKAFQATKSVEICTNLILCYLNSGNLKDAKAHLEIAKKLEPKDQVVVELEGIINNTMDRS